MSQSYDFLQKLKCLYCKNESSIKKIINQMVKDNNDTINNF